MSQISETQRLGAVFGSARSGSTWLGAIVSSNPDVAYRFEPFHRLYYSPQLQAALNDEATTETTDINTLYHALLPAHPLAEKPPFFSKSYPMSMAAGRSLTWPLARKVPLGAWLFRQCYTPRSLPPVVFKEIGLVHLLKKLVPHIPVVYLMRHPCAVVWSMLRGQEQSLMPSDRRQFLQKLLRQRRPDLASEFLHRCDRLSPAEQEALLWRIDTEIALDQIQSHANGLLVFYEDLVEQPLVVAARIFHHLGLPLSTESRIFIEESTLQASARPVQRGEVGINRYFTVFRDPKAACNKWKQQMPATMRDRVMAIVGPSQSFAAGQQQGLWQ
ncbi:MAG: sulfotransferase [Synechococcales bacterium]|nr:sulfotransferase [Synechococcales bacterium]